MRIKCDECGQRISDKSSFCPRCGHPTHLNREYPHASGSPTPPGYVKPDKPLQAAPDTDPEAVAAEAEAAHRTKLWLYLGVLLGVAIVVGCCWWIGMSQAADSAAAAEGEGIEAADSAAMLEEVEAAALPDSAADASAAAAAPAPMPLPEPAPAAAPKPKAPAPEAAPAPAPEAAPAPAPAPEPAAPPAVPALVPESD